MARKKKETKLSVFEKFMEWKCHDAAKFLISRPDLWNEFVEWTENETFDYYSKRLEEISNLYLRLNK